MIEEGTFAKDEIGFGRITDSPEEAVELIVRSLPPTVRGGLKPTPPGRPGRRQEPA